MAEAYHPGPQWQHLHWRAARSNKPGLTVQQWFFFPKLKLNNWSYLRQIVASGPLPAALPSLLPHLISLDVSNNKLTGKYQ